MSCSAKQCGSVSQYIRDGTINVLAMGTRGSKNPAKHRFYLLTERGHSFTVPFANLFLDPGNATANKLLMAQVHTTKWRHSVQRAHRKLHSLLPC